MEDQSLSPETINKFNEINIHIGFTFHSLDKIQKENLLRNYEKLFIEFDDLLETNSAAKEPKKACRSMISLLKESMKE